MNIITKTVARTAFAAMLTAMFIGAGFGHTSPASAQTSGWYSGNQTISQGYGPSSFTFEPAGHGYAHWHSGIDVAFGCGSALVTPYWATVVNDADAIPNGFGSIYRTLRLDEGHDVILGHVQAWYATVGTRIPPGTHVADVGTQGNSTGCHVHFEVRPAGGRFGTDIDPTAWLTSATPPPASHRLVNQAHQLCLDAAAQTIANNGGIVQIWTCVGDTNQQWYSVGNEIRNLADGKCLDANWSTDGNNGGVVQIWSCNNGPNQQWVVNGNAQLVNQAHGLCLDANWGTDGSNGGKVQLWQCNSGPNQKWSTASLPVSYQYTVVAPGGSLNERSAPSTSATLTGSLPNGALINIVCQTTGSVVNGSSIWDKLDNGFYVSDYYTSTPNVGTWSPPIPQC